MNTTATANRYDARPNILLTELQDGTGVLLNLDTKFYFTLNATGLFVWKSIASGKNSSHAIADGIAAKFEVEANVAAADVGELLEELVAEGLVEAK